MNDQRSPTSTPLGIKICMILDIAESHLPRYSLLLDQPRLWVGIKPRKPEYLVSW